MTQLKRWIKGFEVWVNLFMDADVFIAATAKYERWPFNAKLLSVENKSSPDERAGKHF